jgi:deoxyribodipyrimidine photo-lyase
MPVPADRVRQLNTCATNTDGDFVLYWMTANRRLSYNYSLDRAIEHSRLFQKPLVILETLGCRGRWSSSRFHHFVLPGMAEHAATCAAHKVCYYPYVEPTPKAGVGLLETLAARACVVITDDFPAYFLPQMHAALASRVMVQVEAVDSNGIWPMRKTETVFPTAYSFRRFLQKNLRPHLLECPEAEPLKQLNAKSLAVIPTEVHRLWPAASAMLLACDDAALGQLPIDHMVKRGLAIGGEEAAAKTLKRFFAKRFARYGEHRNDPEDEAASGLSPYLHFGHISAHQIVQQVLRAEKWQPDRLASTTKGSREGWWGLSATAEAFLDELITWREIGFNMCAHVANYDQYESLPDWARKTLAKHAKDERPYVYDALQLETADTHDKLWNAAQRQLVREGRMHNYLRMLWGKKILEWSASPEEALEVLIHLNNKYAVDGRNPNSYSGIFWVLGRYDRAWGPERPIYGTIRYMSSDNTARKLPVAGYLKRYDSQGLLFDS